MLNYTEQQLQDEREWLLSAAQTRNFKLSINDADYIASHYLRKQTQIITNTGEELLRLTQGERRKHGYDLPTNDFCYSEHALTESFNIGIDTVKKHITSVMGVE